MPLPLANIFQPIIDVFEQVLLFFHNSIGLGWGLSIIALTVCVRAVLFPLTLKQFKSMRSMQVLAPEMRKLQERYKDDKQRLNQEMMKFYQENKVNPFASCLPLVAQMPVFISLFYMLRKDLKEDICGPALQKAGLSASQIVDTGCDEVAKGSATFWFIPDLTAAAEGRVLVLLLVLYVGSQLASSILMASPTMDKTQRYLFMALPFVFVLFIRNFPAGLLVYWITTNLWTLGQQYLVRRSLGPPPAPPVGEDGKPVGLGSMFKDLRDQASGKPAEKRTPQPVGAPARAVAPPPPPRKKKKRSGRRR